jgi:hypothetical protein
MRHWTKFLKTSKAAASAANDSHQPAEASGWDRPEQGEIVAAYLDLVREQVGAAGIPADAVTIEVAVVGRNPDGLPALSAMLKLCSWSGHATVRLLLGLPLFEARVRRQLRNHWLADVSFFAGLWLHPSAPVRDPQVLLQLRELLRALEGQELRHAGSPGQPASDGLWTLSGTLEPPSGAPSTCAPSGAMAA